MSEEKGPKVGGYQLVTTTCEDGDVVVNILPPRRIDTKKDWK